MRGCQRFRTGVGGRSNPGLAVREARVDEIAALTRFDGRCFGARAWPRDAWQDAVLDPATRTLVVGPGPDFVACAVVLPDAPVTYLASLAVAPEWQGRGVGREMIEVVASLAVRAGARWLELDVDRDNLPARVLYRRSGCVVVARYREDGRARLTLVRRIGSRGWRHRWRGVDMMAGA